MKRWLSLAAAVVALMATPILGTASQDSVHFGPINSGSPDSGTCGNDWANDTYKRVFDASTTPSGGTYTVTESFIAGRFVTVEGASPGACENAPQPTGNSGTIAAGVTGSFNGNFQIVITGGVFNPDATCDTGCDTTANFVATVYGDTATYDIPSFGFTYHANGPGLIQREWFNASGDQGGNHGDIRST
jgi:hypothetical protein